MFFWLGELTFLIHLRNLTDAYLITNSRNGCTQTFLFFLDLGLGIN